MKTKTLHSQRAFLPVLFTFLLCMISMTNALAQTFTVGNLNYSLNDDGVSVTVTGHVDGTNATGELVIPETVEIYGTSYSVTVIGSSAFYGCSGLTGSLVIPNSVITIAYHAFGYCSGFSGSLILGSSIQTLEQEAFDYCTGFNGSLTIPESVTQINYDVFRGCSGFTTLNYNAINCTLGGVYLDWLQGCVSLTTVNIGEDVQVIPSYFLRNHTSFTGGLVIPESVTSIGTQAFNGCSGFTGSLNIPENVTSIGENAFNGCSGFTGSLSIGNSVTSISDNVFNGCNGFTGSLTIPNSVTYIGTTAFSNCSGFSGALTLGVSLTEIDNSAFFGACEGFTSFNVLAENPPTLGNNVFVSADYGMPVLVPCGSLNAYQNADGWSVFTNIQEPTPCMWDITAIAIPSIGGTVTGAGVYEQGTTCTLTATPNEGYYFVNWIEDGVEVSSDATYSFTVEGNRDLVAQFMIPTYTITANVNPSNAGTVTGLRNNFDFEDGMIPDGWSNDATYPWTVVNTAPQPGFNGTYCIMSGNGGVAHSTSSISTTVNFINNGTVSFLAGCWGEGTNDSYDWDKCRFYIDGSIMIDYGAHQAWENVSFDVSAGNHTFTWTYKKDGSINPTGDAFFVDDVTFTGATSDGTAFYYLGETCTLTATPSSDYFAFVNWTEDGEEVSTNAQYSFTVTDDRDLVANFVSIPSCTITATPNPSEGGTIEFNLLQSQYDFDDNSTQGWTTIDADGDGYDWMLGSNIGGFYLVSGASLAGSGHNASNDMMCSGSYSNATGQAITPDNYLVSPQVALGGSISFWACAQDASYAAEHFAVAVSTTNNTSTSAFTIVQEWTMTAKSTGIPSVGRGGNTRSQGNWYHYTVDLSAYSGNGYVAIRHFNCSDQFILNIDDIVFNPSRSSVSASYPQGSTCTLTATPSYGYTFENWTENSNVVSVDAQYSFIVTEDRNLVANFVTLPTCTIVFDLYDSYGDGWNGNKLTVSDDYGFYEELTMDGGSSATYTLNMIDGSHITLGWIYGSWTGECSYTVHFENGFQIFEGSQNIGLTGEFDFNCDDAFTPVAITAVPNFDDRGTVTGAGEFVCGEVCTLTATPNEGHLFSRWIENGVMVSTEATYSFTVTGPRNLVAVFTAPVVDLIVFADDNVKAICVNRWDTDGDGELTYTEAAVVTSLDYAFEYNDEITSFDELQYFTGLTYINDYEFYSCDNLTSMILPENITSIGYDAFYNCNIIGELVIPNSVTYIGASAFNECSSLTSVTVPEGVTSIEEGVFGWCSSLETVNLPNSVETIGNWAFHGCTSLTNLVLPNALTSIGYEAFTNCHSLTGTLELPASVISIDGNAFEDCYSLTGLALPNSLQSIGNNAFKNCSGLRGELTLPESLESVGGYAFYGCDGISVVNYNATNCQTMGSAGEPVFYDCAFEHIRIGENVQNIPNYAFKHCFLVTDIASAPINPPTIYSSTFGMVSRNIPVSVPLGSGEAYRTAQYWEEFFHITEDYSSSPYAYHWNVNVNQFGDNMTVTGIIQIDGVEQAVPYLEIGAFCNDECRGRQLLTYYPQVDRYLVFLMLYGEEGDMFTFKLYNHETNEESTAGCAATVTFEADALLGSFMEPFVFNFSDMQLSQFSQGYNWWSTYIEQEGINGLQMLQEGLGGNGIAIRSQASGYTDYYGEEYGWWGSLSSINNESSYRVITNAPCVASMAGAPAVPSEHPITLNQGWTWMGYVPSSAMDINTALDGMEATMGDVVKSQQGYSEYYAGYGWFGSLNTIEPGTGLMYYSSNANPVTFTYPDGNRGGELKKNITAENNHWVPNVHAYPDNMTVMAVVELGDMELNADKYELAAFAANGECRGSVKLAYAEPLHRHVAFLTVSGKDAAALSFRLYDTETNEEYYDAEESLNFVANAIVGAADDLYVVHFRGTTGMDELANKIQVYPNPVASGEHFNVVLFDSVNQEIHVEVVNALGVVVLVESFNDSSFEMIAPKTSGLYTLRVMVKDKVIQYHKLVVK